jgi:hypothetical protein
MGDLVTSLLGVDVLSAACGFMGLLDISACVNLRVGNAPVPLSIYNPKSA